MTAIPGIWVKIESDKFPIVPGEESEVINEGMYGKALCMYLERNLPMYGLDVNFYCCEDWGWWVDITEQDLNFGFLIYAHTVTGANPYEYAIGSSIGKRLKWSWRRFKKVDVSIPVISAMDILIETLERDEDIYFVERYDEFPPFSKEYS